MKEEFACAVTEGTRLEAYIGRRDEAVLIEIAIEDAVEGVQSVCLEYAEARELSRTLADLADRVERHLAKKS